MFWCMPNYRRRYIKGGTYFFTACLRDRRSALLTDEIAILRRAWRYAQRGYPFETLAAVVLPDHLHCVWRLPEDDQDFSTRWRLIKTEFSRALCTANDDQHSTPRRGRAIWQDRYWEHHIQTETELGEIINYIHFNPVKHGYVEDAECWPFSTLKPWLHS